MFERETSHDTETEAVVINGYQVSAQWDDGQPRVRDVDLAERCGYGCPRALRDRIKRLVRDEELKDFRICRTVRHKSNGLPTEPTNEYWLTLEEALIVIMGCKTEIARKVTREVVRVFMAWRAGKPDAARRADDRVQALQHELLVARAEIAALHAKTISRDTRQRLRGDVRSLAELELGAGHWPSARAATRDIYRVLGELTAWGGKGRSWKRLPAKLAHRAFGMLCEREARIRHILRARADNQNGLRFVPPSN